MASRLNPEPSYSGRATCVRRFVLCSRVTLAIAGWTWRKASHPAWPAQHHDAGSDESSGSAEAGETPVVRPMGQSSPLTRDVVHPFRWAVWGAPMRLSRHTKTGAHEGAGRGYRDLQQAVRCEILSLLSTSTLQSDASKKAWSASATAFGCSSGWKWPQSTMTSDRISAQKRASAPPRSGIEP